MSPDANIAARAFLFCGAKWLGVMTSNYGVHTSENIGKNIVVYSEPNRPFCEVFIGRMKE
jgi:hypothetical protein